MAIAPIVVHPPSGTGGRRVMVHSIMVGIAYSDHDLVRFLEAAGVVDPQNVLDDPQLVEWRGGGPHEWGAM
ncbi:hypothetical protein [Streptomyces cadmiisoli]|uniref:hypothetical protein n=1 Tax=Streptomyces cadmiisoli TaxID=2184053 RepID=UPI003660664E